MPLLPSCHLSKLFAPWVDAIAGFWQDKELKKVIMLTHQLDKSLKVPGSLLSCIYSVAEPHLLISFLIDQHVHQIQGGFVVIEAHLAAA